MTPIPSHAVKTNGARTKWPQSAASQLGGPSSPVAPDDAFVGRTRCTAPASLRNAVGAPCGSANRLPQPRFAHSSNRTGKHALLRVAVGLIGPNALDNQPRHQRGKV